MLFSIGECKVLLFLDMRVGDFDAKNKDFLKMVVGSIVAGVQANLVLRALVLEGGRERTLGTRVGGCDARGGEGRAPSWRVTARVLFALPRHSNSPLLLLERLLLQIFCSSSFRHLRQLCFTFDWQLWSALACTRSGFPLETRCRPGLLCVPGKPV